MILIALGSNQGDRKGQIEAAHRALEMAGVKILKRSSILETPAMLPEGAPSDWDVRFLNQVIAVETNLPPLDLLGLLKSIERAMGRIDRGRWGPREIDLDLLSHGEAVMGDEILTLPHPGLTSREFVLKPLAEIAPEWRYPGHGRWHGATPKEMLKQSPALVGILNLTPDSFSGDGVVDTQGAVDHFARLVEEGADIVDIGAESTRPGATPLTAEDEWARLQPVLKAIQSHRLRKATEISIDTRHAETAKRALAMGADIINDVSGLARADMREVLASSRCLIVVMHALGIPANPKITLPSHADPVAEVLAWKEQVTKLAENAVIPPSRLIFDPGIGFGKTAEQSLALVKRADELVRSGGQWLYGHSRKSFLKLFHEAPADARDALTLGLSVELAKAGVAYLRVHDVASHARYFTEGA